MILKLGDDLISDDQRSARLHVDLPEGHYC